MEGMLRLGADHRPSPRHRTFTIKEGKNALKWMRLSCRRFLDNQARLPLFAVAYNLANFLRELTLPRPIQKDLPGIHDNPCRNLGRSAFERTTAYLLGAQGARLRRSASSESRSFASPYLVIFGIVLGISSAPSMV